MQQVDELCEELLALGVLEWLTVPDEWGCTLQLVPVLQDDFVFNQSLVSFVLVVFDLFDPESEMYSFDVVFVVEVIFDDLFLLLMAQVFKERGEVVVEMKVEGIEYEEWMELLEEVIYFKLFDEPLCYVFL